jgi:acetoacetate decarboxylase
MDESEVKKRAFAMPLTSPAFPPGPYRFINREFFIVTSGLSFWQRLKQSCEACAERARLIRSMFVRR